MFVVLLRFAHNKAQAHQFMPGHKAWIAQGLDDGVFLMVGSLEPQLGGALVAHGVSRPELEARVDGDPFVAAGVVQAEILEITPSRANPRLAFVLEGSRPAVA